MDEWENNHLAGNPMAKIGQQDYTINGLGSSKAEGKMVQLNWGQTRY
jgi:hypothetical protein